VAGKVHGRQAEAEHELGEAGRAGAATEDVSRMRQL
jgi:hypothetical protein